MNSEPLEVLLSTSFNLPSFRAGQREIISAVLDKKDVLAVLPTGGGKSLCYQYPAIYLKKLVIVISPLIALMKDQVNHLNMRGIAAGCLHSGQGDEERRSVFSAIEKNAAYILYLSPERAQKDGFKTWIKKKSIALFAIDEAHCVSQWGHDFREEYAELGNLKQLRPDVPVLALTASATPTVLKDVAKNLNLNKPEKMVYGFYRSNLYYQVESCSDDETKSLILLQAINQTPTGRILIYCGTRKVTENLAAFLQERFTKVGYYHAGLSTEERNQTQSNYMLGKIRILVATNAFGMGIDQPDVRLVVHFQMPANIDSLYQEMGRAGRDGKLSTCLMLYSKKDKGLQSYFIQNSTAIKAIKDLRWRNLDALVNYSEGSECRHSEILTYYKDSQRISKCGHCDSCDPQSDRRIRSPEIKKPIIDYISSKLRKKKDIAESDLDAIQDQRLQRLKKWRKEKAAELDQPAFVIFNDRTLRELAVNNPQSMDALRKIYGIGESKLENFGWEILAELND